MPNEQKAAKRRANRKAQYRNLPIHKERMIARRAEQNLRISHYTQRDRHVMRDVARFSAYWRGVNAKNGVGRPPKREAAQ